MTTTVNVYTRRTPVNVVAPRTSLAVVGNPEGAPVVTPTLTVGVVSGGSGVAVTASTLQAVRVIGGVQGPAGADAEEVSMNYVPRIDFVEDTPSSGLTTVYRGWAAPGDSEDDEPVWRIQRMVLNADNEIIDGGFAAATFTSVWDNRVSYTYT